MSIQLPTDYQNFIHKSRYARFIEEKGRRENWDETVDRYLNFFQEDLDRKHGYKPSSDLISELRESILQLKVVPSMRAMMTAGEALRLENLAGFNCAYLPIDRVKSFADALYILMCGTGVGFSVERQVIKKLPTVPDQLTKTDKVHVIQDSKQGWAEAFLQHLEWLYAGEIGNFDASLVRPAGERLKTFGGRASGPEPFLHLIEFTTRIFTDAKGHQLNSIQCHEIVTKTGEIVVVGGVRRSAEISLSNLSDGRMREAKSGNWFLDKPHLALANNSVAYTEKPDELMWMEEWASIHRSRSGERGVFNRHGAVEKILRLGRRDHRFEFGTNPCGEIILRPRGLCNLSEAIIRSGDSVTDIAHKARMASILGTWQSTLTDFNFVDPEWKVNAEEERLLGVSMTGIYGHRHMRGDEGLESLALTLGNLKNVVIKNNALEARAIGIQPSVATTTNKPSGTVSQLALVPSGIHPANADYYFRRVTGDNKDPVTAFMSDLGVPHEPHHAKPQDMTVFTFPASLGEDVKTIDKVSAIEHLELIKLYNLHWSEHAVSATVSIKRGEWPTVGGWVYDNFDDLCGVSFLPYFVADTTYKQIPEEACTREQYLDLKSKMPALEWSGLGEWERGEDTVTGTREFACSGNTCEVVEVSKPL